MAKVTIAVCVHQLPDQFRATLEGVYAHTPGAYDLVVIANGPDPAVDAALAQTGLRVLRNASALGGAACLNRAFRETASEIVALVESGTIPGPGWLDLLRHPLVSDWSCGITGPSANTAWNEQGV